MHEYHVLRNQKITPSTILLTLEKASASKPFSFRPGQYAAISFKRNGRPTPTRCFSIVNSPTDGEFLQCSIRTKGRFTNAVRDLSEGDEVTVRGSFGGFTFEPRRDKEAVFIAGGIGIAPFMSMIQYVMDNKLTNKITLIYSNSDQEDVPFLEQLAGFKKRMPNLQLLLKISRGPVDKLSSFEVETGRISGDTLDYVTSSKYTGKSFFICGPPAFMLANADILSEKGVPETRIFMESFIQGAKHKASKKMGMPFWLYVASASGLAMTSFAIAVSDILNMQPQIKTVIPANTVVPTCQTNTRQDDLEDDDSSTQTVVQCPITTTTSTTPSTSPAPTPVCTTTQSGVTTCN